MVRRPRLELGISEEGEFTVRCNSHSANDAFKLVSHTRFELVPSPWKGDDLTISTNGIKYQIDIL